MWAMSKLSGSYKKNFLDLKVLFSVNDQYSALFKNYHPFLQRLSLDVKRTRHAVVNSKQDKLQSLQVFPFPHTSPSVVQLRWWTIIFTKDTPSLSETFLPSPP